MLIVSHYAVLKTTLEVPDHTILRINVAWLKSTEELIKLLDELKYDIYLDYPYGRSKPPKPVIELDETIKIANKFNKIKYLAISNIEDPNKILSIREKLSRDIEIVPKIETKKGIKNLEKIIQESGIKNFMLDKEDLYIDVNMNFEEFEFLVELTRSTAKKMNVNILELKGVIFAPYEHE